MGANDHCHAVVIIGRSTAIGLIGSPAARASHFPGVTEAPRSGTRSQARLSRGIPRIRKNGRGAHSRALPTFPHAVPLALSRLPGRPSALPTLRARAPPVSLAAVVVCISFSVGVGRRSAPLRRRRRRAEIRSVPAASRHPSRRGETVPSGGPRPKVPVLLIENPVI